MSAGSPLVVGVGRVGDRHLEAVGAACEQAGGRFVVLDYRTLPESTGLSVSLGAQTQDVGAGSLTLRIGEAESVWWRRPELPLVSSQIRQRTARRFAANEWQQALNGLPHLIAKRVVNAPGPSGIAHSKSLQLTLASEVGLAVPRTLMTNSESDARDFIAQVESDGGRVALKAFAGVPRAAYPTTLLDAYRQTMLASIRWAPVILQQYVDADCDVRAVVVGEQVFAARIDAHPDAYPNDYRVNLRQATIAPISLPAAIADALITLTKRLGLDIGAADLRLSTRSQVFTFLEINPSGEWLFLDRETAEQATRAVASMLIGPEETVAA